MKKRGLNFKFTRLFLGFSVLLVVLLSGVNYKIYENDLLKQYSDKAMNAASTAAYLLDRDKIAHYSKTREMDEAYAEEIGFIDNLALRLGVENLYVLVPVSDTEVMFIYDASMPGDGILDSEYERMVLGDMADYDGENYSAARSAIEHGTESNNLEIVDGEFGYLASAYELLYDDKGELIGFVGADFLMSDIKEALRNYLIRNLCLAVLVVVGGIALLLYRVKRLVISPVEKIAESAIEFARTEDKENLSVRKAEIHTGDELEDLNDTLGRMMGDITNYISNLAQVTAEKEKISAELNVASSIQESMLPRIFPPFPGRKDIDIYAMMAPAREVGGDFYDFFLIDKDRMAVVIGDVSGKGVPAALFMVIAKTLLKNQALSGKSVGDIFTTVNQQLAENNKEGMFVSSFMGILNLASGRFTYANAGHNLPLYKKSGGKYEWGNVLPAMVLGGFEGVSYQENTVKLGQGDKLFLYTNGVNEAWNPDEEFYGEDRLIEKLNEADAQAGSLRALLQDMRADVKEFARGTEQTDDMTMLVLQYLGSGEDFNLDEEERGSLRF